MVNAFNDLQRANKIIPEQRGFYEYSKCYFTQSDEYEETIFLEDLKEAGFDMIDQQTEPITIDHATLILSIIGKWHALSFALRDKQPGKFELIVGNLPEVFIDDKRELLIHYFNELTALTYATIKEDEIDIRTKLENIFGKSYFHGTKRFVDGFAAEPYAVICHGDFKTNNFMFKFDENRKATDSSY